MKLVFPDDPAKKMDEYLTLTDWALLEHVRGWAQSQHAGRRRLGQEWAHILNRNVKWKMAYNTVLSDKDRPRGMDFPSRGHFEKQIQKHCPRASRSYPSKSIWLPRTHAPIRKTWGIHRCMYSI